MAAASNVGPSNGPVSQPFAPPPDPQTWSLNTRVAIIAASVLLGTGIGFAVCFLSALTFTAKMIVLSAGILGGGAVGVGMVFAFKPPLQRTAHRVANVNPNPAPPIAPPIAPASAVTPLSPGHLRVATALKQFKAVRGDASKVIALLTQLEEDDELEAVISKLKKVEIQALVKDVKAGQLNWISVSRYMNLGQIDCLFKALATSHIFPSVAGESFVDKANFVYDICDQMSCIFKKDHQPELSKMLVNALCSDQNFDYHELFKELSKLTNPPDYFDKLSPKHGAILNLLTQYVLGAFTSNWDKRVFADFGKDWMKLILEDPLFKNAPEKMEILKHITRSFGKDFWGPLVEEALQDEDTAIELLINVRSEPPQMWEMMRKCSKDTRTFWRARLKSSELTALPPDILRG